MKKKTGINKKKKEQVSKKKKKKSTIFFLNPFCLIFCSRSSLAFIFKGRKEDETEKTAKVQTLFLFFFRFFWDQNLIKKK